MVWCFAVSAIGENFSAASLAFFYIIKCNFKTQMTLSRILEYLSSVLICDRQRWLQTAKTVILEMELGYTVNCKGGNGKSKVVPKKFAQISIFASDFSKTIGWQRKDVIYTSVIPFFGGQIYHAVVISNI